MGLRNRLTAVPAGRFERLSAAFEQAEAAATDERLSPGEVLEAIARTGRLEAVLRARYLAVSTPHTPAPISDAPRYLGAAQAASYLGVSRSTVWRLAKAGELSCRRPSEGTARFDREELDAYMRPPGRVR